jgi:serine/threonine protein kinase
MPLSSGDKLGPYEILAPIGKGGMGEVYRARDPRLNRDVAIKVSAAQFTERFEREAKAIAALNHPNICQIYDVGPNYIVMEFIEGEAPKGPLPIEEALRIAHQIADALEAAHDKGITHRDLKPGNIKIKPDGTVKVLDFGLAKVARTAGAPSENSPTLTIGMTEAGMILGTASYMAPEQARAKETVDKRADIWAFGVVLYELITGKRMFTGDDVGEILAKVIRDEPDLSGVPTHVLPLLKRCLEKDPKKRLRDIGDWELLLVESGAGSQAAPRSPLPWIIAAAATVAALVLGLVSYRHVTEEPARVLKFSVAPPENGFIDTSSGSAIALSPNGNQLAFVARAEGKSAVWVRDLSTLITRPLPGTEGAGGTPFWSPDSRSVAFFAGGKLKKIDAAGGPALLVCDADPGRSGTWSKNGVIVFQLDTADRLFRVPAAGGIPVPVTALEAGEAAHRFPWFLPDGRHFLYTAMSANNANKTGVYLGDLQSGTRRLIVPGATNAMYTPPGYVVFMNENVLMAQPFDAGSAQTTGDPVPVAEQVDYSQVNARGQFSISQNGVLTYIPGATRGTNQLGWYDRTGKSLGPVGAPGDVNDPAISPDEKSVVFRRNAGAGSDLWVLDLSRGTETRFTSDASINGAPVWSPQGDRIVFASSRRGRVFKLYQKAASGSGQDEPLLPNSLNDAPTQWSRDGRFIVYSEIDPRSKYDIWVLPTEGAAADRKPIPFLRTEFNELFGQLSPDSHWMAFSSNRSGRPEVYVRPFPPGEGEWTISIAGGYAPRWRGDGKELFFVAADGKMMSVSTKAVPVTAIPGVKPSFEPDVPVVLFDGNMVAPAILTNVFQYDVTADGKRFLIDRRGGPGAVSSPPLTVVTNWTAGLKQ